MFRFIVLVWDVGCLSRNVGLLNLTLLVRWNFIDHQISKCALQKVYFSKSFHNNVRTVLLSIFIQIFVHSCIWLFCFLYGNKGFLLELHQKWRMHLAEKRKLFNI